jgi:hypothetical protein
MTIARSLDLCNQLVALAETVPGFPSGDGSAIQRAYAVVLNVDPDDPTTFIWGRQVYFFPATQKSDPGDRTSLLCEYAVGCVIAEMYLTTPAVFNSGVLETPGVIGQGQPPDTWTDARVTWTEDLFDALKEPGFVQSTPGTLGLSYYSTADMEANITMIYDRDELLERKLFFSEMQFIFRGFTNLTGGN